MTANSQHELPFGEQSDNQPTGSKRRVPRPRRSQDPPGATGAATALLDVSAAAVRLGTPERFVRRLVDQRRITFVKVGK